MKVSEVRLKIIDNDRAVKAIGSFTLDDAFVVKNIRVMEDRNGHHFVAFPSKAKADGTYEDVAFPLSKELYAHITGVILGKYKELAKEQLQEQA